MRKPTGPPPRDPRATLAEWSVRTPIGCLEWRHYTNKAGYGKVGLRDRVYNAHRISWEIANGREVRPSHHIHHLCHNPACIEPDHLQEMPAQRHVAENGRAMQGEGSVNAKLTADDVLAIRTSHTSLGKLAAQYGVQKPAIWKVQKRRSWRHLP